MKARTWPVKVLYMTNSVFVYEDEGIGPYSSHSSTTAALFGFPRADEDCFPRGCSKTSNLLTCALCFSRPRESRHYLVNGEVVPSIELTSGSWVRFRMAFAGHGNSHAISILDPEGNCEMAVLAKDGVYLAEVPREEAKLFFTAASR